MRKKETRVVSKREKEIIFNAKQMKRMNKQNVNRIQKKEIKTERN